MRDVIRYCVFPFYRLLETSCRKYHIQTVFYGSNYICSHVSIAILTPNNDVAHLSTEYLQLYMPHRPHWQNQCPQCDWHIPLKILRHSFLIPSRLTVNIPECFHRCFLEQLKPKITSQTMFGRVLEQISILSLYLVLEQNLLMISFVIVKHIDCFRIKLCACLQLFLVKMRLLSIPWCLKRLWFLHNSHSNLKSTNIHK